MKDVKVSECRFSADIVPYMYAELPAASCADFETHLLECTSCTDEFAALSNARFEVYDWKKLEFDALPTPTFEIPFASDVNVSAGSWVEKIRAAFSPAWTIPGVAFAGLVIASIFTGVFVLSGDNGTEIAAGVSDTAVESASSELSPEKADAPVKIESKEDVRAAVRARPSSVPAAKQAYRLRAVRSTSSATTRHITELREASASNEQKKIPRLNDFTVEEDTSLRLAELFDDLDTRN